MSRGCCTFVVALLCGLAVAGPTGDTYCTGIKTSVTVSSDKQYLGAFFAQLQFDSPRPHVTRYRTTAMSSSVVDELLQFGAIRFYDITDVPTPCYGIGCSGIVQNGNTDMRVQTTYNGTNLTLNTMVFTNLYQGTIYEVASFEYTPEAPCVEFQEIVNFTPRITTNVTVCCNRWTPLIPTDSQTTCKQLTSKTVYIDGNSSLASINATIELEDRKLIITVGDVVSINYGDMFSARIVVNSYYGCSKGCDINLYTFGSQVYVTTTFSNANGASLLSTLGYLEYRQGRIVGFNGIGLTSDQPCVRQSFPYVPLPNNTLPGVTSTSELCCTQFGDVEPPFYVR